MKGFNVVLPRRVVKQPLPEICAGGDCGACVLAGLIGFEVSDAYRWNDRERKEEIEALSWPSMRNALYQLCSHYRLQHMMDQVPMFMDLRPASTWIWGSPSWTMSIGWFNWITLAIMSGYYGLASVDSKRRGPIEGNAGDHWIMICGVREVWPETAGTIAHEILISNSSRSNPDEEWVSVIDFLSKWGGYNVLLAKPLDAPKFSVAS